MPFIRNIARALALQIGPLQRLAHDRLSLANENLRLQRHIAQLDAERASLIADHEKRLDRDAVMQAPVSRRARDERAAAAVLLGAFESERNLLSEQVARDAALFAGLPDLGSDLGKQVKKLARHEDDVEIALAHQTRRAAELENSLQAAALEKSVILCHQQQDIAAYRELEARLDAIENSTSWKLTHPLRKALQRSPTLRKVPRRAAKLVWWTLSRQLGARLKTRRGVASAAPDLQPPQLSQRDPKPPLTALHVPAETPAVPSNSESARPLEIDYSLAVPLGIPFEARVPRFAVILHLFHERLAAEFRSYLEQIPHEFDLFISTPHRAGKFGVERTFDSWSRGNLDIRIVPNRGRDIAPKLLGFPDVYDNYEFVLHLHSKESNHTSVLALWRQFLLENLLGSPEVVGSVFEIFRRRPEVGIIASQHFETVRQWIDWGGDFEIADGLAHRMGFALDRTTVLDFPSGSMFWARSAALKPLLTLDLTFDDFPEEAGQIDGTPAHAIERLYFYTCEHAGFDWIKIARPELFASTPAIFSAHSADELDRFVTQFTLRLLAPDGPLPRTTPPVPIDRPTPHLLEVVQSRSLGLGATIDAAMNVVIGLVPSNRRPGTLRTAIDSARLSIEQAGLRAVGRIHVLDTGESSSDEVAHGDPVVRRPVVGTAGFGAGHNLLMRAAFAEGADLYIAAAADGAFHPEGVEALVKVVIANYGRVIVDALRFPVELPKPYDPQSLDTPWVSGVCMALPRQVFEELGGFDEAFAGDFGDVDLSWRARASGIPLKTCPRGLFLHGRTTPKDDPESVRMRLQSGVILARKWGARTFEAWLQTELGSRGFEMAETQPKPVSPEWRRFADFGHQFNFAEPRW